MPAAKPLYEALGRFEGLVAAKEAKRARRAAGRPLEAPCVTYRGADGDYRCRTCGVVWDASEDKPDCPRQPNRR